MINVFVGYDPREAVAYHAFCQSVIERASVPVSFVPLAATALKGFDGKRDGSNAFIYSRFLVPHLMGYKGLAIFADGDMICNADIAELANLADPYMAVQVVKHDYKTKHPTKYLGNKNADYPRKNWSSLILWNCGHFANKCLTPNYITEHDGAHLHRFGWLKDERIGSLPPDWNFLVGEEEKRPDIKLVHYTIGVPSFSEYNKCDYAEAWHLTHYRMNKT